MIGDIRKELDFLKLLLRNAQPAQTEENQDPRTADQSTPSPNASLEADPAPEAENEPEAEPAPQAEPAPEADPPPDLLDSSVISIEVENADSDEHLN